MTTQKDTTGETAVIWSATLAELAGTAADLADDIALLPVADGMADPAVLGTGGRLMVLARDLSLVVAGYLSSLQLRVDDASPSARSGEVLDSTDEVSARVAGSTRTGTDPALQDAVDTAELVVRAQHLHMLMMSRAAQR